MRRVWPYVKVAGLLSGGASAGYLIGYAIAVAL